MVEVLVSTAAPPRADQLAAVRKRKTHSKSRQGCGNCKLRRVKCDEAKPGCRRCQDYGVRCSYSRKPAADAQLSFGEEISLVVETAASLSASTAISSSSSSSLRSKAPSAASLAPLCHGKEPSGVFPSFVTADMVNILAMKPQLTRTPSPSTSMLGLMNHQLNSNMNLNGNPVYDLDYQDLSTVGRFLSRTLATIGTAHVREAYQKEGFRLACSVRFPLHLKRAAYLGARQTCVRLWPRDPDIDTNQTKTTYRTTT
jgi:hypothetical protein